MHLTPHEQERLMIRVAADLVERRLTREPGLKLNYPEVMALFAAYVLEEARHDTKTVAQLMDTKLSDVAAELNKRVPAVTTIEVMDGVQEMIRDVQVEATFKDGTKLVTIPDPLGKARPNARVYPGKYELLSDDGRHAVPYNESNPRYSNPLKLQVENKLGRPIQVGSHFHFAEVNDGLTFDRTAARGMRLHIAAGTSERFEPNDKRDVYLVPIQGDQLVKGLRAGKTPTEWPVP
ncbi:urease subunit gamma [Streptomyces sp. NPDC086554]|uniref:urease subunit gamma n=1 Tax=Streptomyces sp. NPDC086554 TaxID=3154864 RepID=UPI003432D38D